MKKWIIDGVILTIGMTITCFVGYITGYCEGATETDRKSVEYVTVVFPTTEPAENVSTRPAVMLDDEDMAEAMFGLVE